jgi:hypothetical protein
MLFDDAINVDIWRHPGKIIIMLLSQSILRYSRLQLVSLHFRKGVRFRNPMKVSKCSCLKLSLPDALIIKAQSVSKSLNILISQLA